MLSSFVVFHVLLAPYAYANYCLECMNYDQTCSFQCSFNAGRNYFGTKSTTKAGVPCQNWVKNAPHDTSYYTKKSHWGIGDHNYCRVADKIAPWCFTTDRLKEWDYCFDNCTFSPPPPGIFLILI